jgi:hypothetical protein
MKPVVKRRHVPSQRPGCYYERIEDCCWLCLARFAWTATAGQGR